MLKIDVLNMLKSYFDESGEIIEIVHNTIPKKIWDKFDSIGDILLLIFALIAVKGVRHIITIFDVAISLTIILIFSVLQIINHIC